MASSTWLLSGLLIFIVVTVYSTDDENILNLNNIKPQHYKIRITLRAEKNIFFGECDIEIQILNTTQQISMYSKELGITSATLINNVRLSDQNKFRTHKVISHKYNYESNIVSLHFNGIISPGYYILSVKYSGVISTEGGFQQFRYINNNVM